jgi:hypothetical protein
MSLNWNIGSISNFKSICLKTDENGVERLLGRTEGLIWATMMVGLNGITAKNADKFYARLSLFERINGALRKQWKDGDDTPTDIFYTAEEVRLHIGLGTNATNESDAAWLKRITSRHLSDAMRNYATNLRKIEDEAAEPDLSTVPLCDGCGKRSASVEDAGGRVDEGADGLAFCADCRK